jgi:hypothetical protein
MNYSQQKLEACVNEIVGAKYNAFSSCRRRGNDLFISLCSDITGKSCSVLREEGLNSEIINDFTQNHLKPAIAAREKEILGLWNALPDSEKQKLKGESEKKDPVLQAKLEEEARESFSVDITNNKVSHKSRKKKNKNKKKNRRK